MSRLTMAAMAGLALVLIGCGSATTTGAGAPTATGTVGPPVQRSLPAPSRSSPPVRHTGNVLTVADSGATVSLVTGQLLTVDLVSGSGVYAWDRPRLTGSGLRLVSVSGGYPEHGPMRAVYLAVSPGVGVVTTSSDVPCLHAHPRCMVAQRLWTARVIIRAHL